VGKRNLESAIQQSGKRVSVAWKPFLLRPGMPEDGKEKGGDPSTRAGARMKQAGSAVGIDFTGLTDRYPNSIKAHTLLAYAEREEPALQNQLQEILFRHYFTDGRYPDETNLRAAAQEAGIKDVDAAMAAVADDKQRLAVRQEAEMASRSGISGVPFFFINGKPFGSGAQPPAAFLEEFSRA